MPSFTQELTDFVCRNSYEHLPENVRTQAKRCFIDWMGVAIAAAGSPTVKILGDLIRDLGGRKQASIIGSIYKTTVLNASLVNGAMAHVLDFDDTHYEALVHSSAFLVPAILAGGEWKRRNGREAITAFVTGYEAAVRVSFATGKGAHQLELGWHPTSTIGHIGSAICFGKLLRLNQQEMAAAIGIAATQAAGLRKVFGTMTKHFHPGKAAHDGVLASLLASRGFSAPLDILDGKDGFCQVFSKRFQGDKILDGLGKRFEILNNGFKPYPSCHQTHALINACLDISSKIESSSIKEVFCEVSPLALEVAGIRNPKDENEAKFSLYYCAARGLMGDVGSSKFVAEEIQQEVVQRLMSCIQIRRNPSFGIANARVEVKVDNGREMISTIDRLKGGPTNPMTDDEMDEKFLELAFPFFKEAGKAKNFLRELRRIEEFRNISSLMNLLNKLSS